MRRAFIQTLTELAQNDDRIVLLTADLGFMFLEPFEDTLPGRFFNVGVSEQNMIGLATGLAEAAFIPFVYSIVPFAVLRPYEFIRNGPIYHQLPVRIVGVGGGFDYGTNGISHYGLEDIGVLRILPGITLVAPADHLQTRTAVELTWDLQHPVYYRLGKDDINTIPGLEGRFEIGKPQLIKSGTDLLLISLGSITKEAYRALEILGNKGINSTLMVISNIHEGMNDRIVDILRRFKLAVSIEEHFINGGIGSLISEIIAENGLNCKVVRCGVRNIPRGLSGSQTYMRSINGLTGDQISETARIEYENLHRK